MSKLDFTHSYLIPLFISAILSLRAFRLGWPVYYKFFSLFLWSMVIVETIANSNIITGREANNWWIYDLSFPLQYLFYGYYFFHIIRQPNKQRLVKLLTTIVVIFSIINLFKIQKLSLLNNYTIIAGCTLVIGLSATYYFQCLDDADSTALYKRSDFWIVSGAFLCHLGILAFFSFFYAGLTDIKAYFDSLGLVTWSNIIMYTFYSISYLCLPYYK